MGTRLIDRTTPVPTLTAAGRRYLLRLEPGYEAMLKAQGRATTLGNERSNFDSVQVMYEAAALGLGLAIGIRPLVDPFLANERLVRPMQSAVVLPGAYYIAALPALRRERAVQAFWNWLVEETSAPSQR